MRMLIMGLIASVVLSGSTVMAGSGCCSMSKKDSPACTAPGKAGCSDIWKDMNLTDEQKAKLAEVQAECEKTGYSEDSQKKCMKVMEEVLTPEQLEKCKAECTKKGMTGCPMMKKGEAPAEKAE